MAGPALADKWFRTSLEQRVEAQPAEIADRQDRKSTRLNSSHSQNSYAVFCLKKKNSQQATASSIDNAAAAHRVVDGHTLHPLPKIVHGATGLVQQAAVPDIQPIHQRRYLAPQ